MNRLLIQNIGSLALLHSLLPWLAFALVDKPTSSLDATLYSLPFVASWIAWPILAAKNKTSIDKNSFLAIKIAGLILGPFIFLIILGIFMAGVMVIGFRT